MINEWYENLEMTDEHQVMFQPLNWDPDIFGIEHLVGSDHLAESHPMEGNCGEYWGPNSLLVKTGDTTVAINKLEGMLVARLVIFLSMSLLASTPLVCFGEAKWKTGVGWRAYCTDPRGQKCARVGKCSAMKGIWRGQVAYFTGDTDQKVTSTLFSLFIFVS